MNNRFEIHETTFLIKKVNNTAYTNSTLCLLYSNSWIIFQNEITSVGLSDYFYFIIGLSDYLLFLSSQ